MTTTDFISSVWLAWTGRELTEQEHRLIERCVVLAIDHGKEPPSASVTRTVASCGKPLADSVAAGMLTFGPRHGNAGGAAAVWLRAAVEEHRTAQDLVDASVTTGQRLAGIGHPIYDIDPRTTEIFALAKEVLPATPHCDFILSVAQAVSSKKGKTMPVNIDGAIAAVMCELGVEAELADALFILARTAGLIKHAREEAAQSTSYKRG